MRLSEYQIAAICRSAKNCFGQNVRVWLFGSRTDDSKRGGDIDLYVEPETSEPSLLIDAKLKFLGELHRQLGEQKIDVVLPPYKSDQALPIHQIARTTGIALL